MTRLVVSTAFTKALGGRYRADGPWSGQQFREEHLSKAMRRALDTNEKLIVDFDGVYGMPTSFLEEAFGGLIREFPRDAKKILDLVEIDAPATPKLFTFVNLARTYMQNEARRRGA